MGTMEAARGCRKTGKDNIMAHTDNFWIGITTLVVVGGMLAHAFLAAL